MRGALAQISRRPCLPKVLERGWELAIVVEITVSERRKVRRDLLPIALGPHAPHDVGVIEADVIRLEGEDHSVAADGANACITHYCFIVQQPYTRIQMATTTTAPAVAVSVFSCVMPTVGSHWRRDFTGSPLSP